jgi:hypothetical protein
MNELFIHKNLEMMKKSHCAGEQQFRSDQVNAMSHRVKSNQFKKTLMGYDTKKTIKL